MVTALLELNHCPTIETPLPTSLLSSLKQGIGSLILGTFLLTMPLGITKTAHFRLTSGAFAVFPTVLLSDR